MRPPLAPPLPARRARTTRTLEPRTAVLVGTAGIVMALTVTGVAGRWPAGAATGQDRVHAASPAAPATAPPTPPASPTPTPAASGPEQ